MEQVEVVMKILRKGWLIILSTLIAAIVIALIGSAITTPVYRTTARYIVSPDPQLFVESDLLRRGLDTLDRDSIVSTYAEVFDSSRIRNSARTGLGLETGALSGYSVSAVALPNTSVLELAVEGSDPQIVAQLANQIGADSTVFLEDLYLLYDVTLLDEARIPNSPITPNTQRNIAVAAVLGLIAGLGLAYLYVAYDEQKAALASASQPIVGPASSD